jgi:Domain of unknown function (DUF4326)
MKTALDVINSQSPIPYVKGILSRKEADSLFARLQEILTATPERNKQNRNTFYRILKYATYVVDPAIRTKAVYGPKIDIKDAPPEILDLLKKLSDHVGVELNYASVLGYRDQFDHINFHQHTEDSVEDDASVYVISLGHNRELVTRPLVLCEDPDCKKAKNGPHKHGTTDRSLYESIMPEHGSLYILPSGYNVTHEHEIPNSKFKCGLRISINCKRERAPEPGPEKKPFQRAPGPPRIYDQHAWKLRPSDAVNCDRETIFGNHNRHKTDTEEGRAAWAAEVAVKMRDPEFAAKVLELKGKDLLCWCTPSQVKQGLCHAIAWLNIANDTPQKCKHPGCKKFAHAPRPAYGIYNNGFCFELHGGSEYPDDLHPVQIARGIPKHTPEEIAAYDKRLADMRKEATLGVFEEVSTLPVPKGAL